MVGGLETVLEEGEEFPVKRDEVFEEVVTVDHCSQGEEGACFEVFENVESVKETVLERRGASS